MGMAEIYQFPQVRHHLPSHTHFPLQQSLDRATQDQQLPILQQRDESSVPSLMWQAVESVRLMPKIPGMSYSEMPTPSSLADFGIGVEMQYPVALHKTSGEEQRETSLYGWIMILFANAPDAQTHSQWQCVAFMNEPKFSKNDDSDETQVLLTSVQQRLHNAQAYHISGTVSSTENHSFGMDDTKIQDSYEIRASWTPNFESESDISAADYVHVWSSLMIDVGYELVDQYRERKNFSS